MKPFHNRYKKTDFLEIYERFPLWSDYILCVNGFYLLFECISRKVLNGISMMFLSIMRGFIEECEKI